MPHYVVLLSPYNGGVHETENVDLDWNSMYDNGELSDDQVDFLNDYSEVIGLLCAGVFEAHSEQEAIEKGLESANNDPNFWGGCVA